MKYRYRKVLTEGFCAGQVAECVVDIDKLDEPARAALEQENAEPCQDDEPTSDWHILQAQS